MRFSVQQYDEALEALTLARHQLEPDGNPCAVCGDSGHMAWECGHNPLLAQVLCQQIARDSDALHETLHHLAGHDFAFGVQRGPAKIVGPLDKDERP